MYITERQKDIIYNIFNEIDLELDLNNEKAKAVLTEIIYTLFSETKPNEYEYKYNYKHFCSIVNVVYDYLIVQDKKIKELINLENEFYELLQKSKIG